MDIDNIMAGTPVLAMTFGMHYCGIFRESRSGYLLLDKARLISEVGRMTTFTSGYAISGQAGHHSEPIYAEDDAQPYAIPLDVIQSFGAIKALPKDG